MPCINCNERPAVCDDYCLQCEIAYHVAHRDEAESLLEEYAKNPDRLADWRPVIDVLMRMA